jgi:hypothetical protein
MEKNSYTRAEVLAARHKLPDQGLHCELCGRTIPVFADLAGADEERVRQNIYEGRKITAIGELARSDGLFVTLGQCVGSTRVPLDSRERNEALSVLWQTVANVSRTAMPVLRQRLA